MDAFQVIVLALLQGFTEFLPISSSGHLVLVPALANWKDQGVSFDVAVHVGTLLAVVWYFRQDLIVLTRDWVASVRSAEQVGQSMLAWAVIIATLPAGVCGYALNHFGVEAVRSPMVIATATLVFGLFLGWADWRGRQDRNETQLRWRDVWLIGLAQALALIPGTSRSGVTMSAAMALGLTRAGAARFSFLLSIPIIAAAGSLKGREAFQAGEMTDWFGLGLGVLVSGVSAYICIHYFLKLIPRIGLMPFVVYRVILALAIFAFL